MRSSINAMLQLGLVTGALVFTSMTTTMPTLAQQAPDDKRWTIKIQTQKLNRAFQYRGSNLNPVAKANVSIKKLSDPSAPQLFETIWCHDGKPIGMERKGPYLVRVGHLTDIEVTQKEHSEEENKAVAFVLLRLALAAYHHVNPILTITIPEQSFDSVVNQLQNRKCEEFHAGADETYEAGVLFNLVSDPPGREERLIYKTREP